MIRRLYDWTLRLSAHPRAIWWLGFISFIESSVFPIPPDVLLAPMVLANRAKAWQFALVCTISSVLGGLFGYAIGYFLFDTIGKPILDFYGYAGQFASFQETYNDWGIWLVAGAGITPFPFKVITIASGVTQLNIILFTVTAFFARALRFYLVAGLLWKYGAPLQIFIEKYLGWLATLGFLLLLGGFASVKFLF